MVSVLFFIPFLVHPEVLTKNNVLKFRFQSVNDTQKIAIITRNDMKLFREKQHEEPIDDLHDLEGDSDDIKEVIGKIKALDDKALNLRNRVADNGFTCSIQVKYYITEIVQRTKELCDYCVVQHLNKEEPSKIFNVSTFCPVFCTNINAKFFRQINQKNCTLDLLASAEIELDDMSPKVEDCRSSL